MSKVIKAVFTGRFCKTQRVFQFDTDDKLQIVNVDLPANFSVDFSNSKTGDSVSVLATSDTVQIPPDLFVPGSEIYAWIWLSDSNGGHTRCEATIPIDPRARRTGTEPTPAQASAWDEAVDTLNETVEGIPAVVNAALTEAKESGEFDGEDGTDGSNAWLIDVAYTNTVGNTIRAQTEHLIGPPDARPMYGDILFVSDGRFGNINSPGTSVTRASTLGDLHGGPGEDGYSPAVTITEITGGHRVTITDETHPQGQSFDVMDGQGGSGSSDYADLTNKPSINSVTLSGDKSAADLGLLQSTGNAYRTASIPMGELDSTSTATVMTATVSGITELRDGVCVWLRNGVVKSASGVTLNINSLGAKPIYNSLSGAVVTTTFTAASTYLFVYNSTRVTGGCWDMVYGYDTNTSYTPVTLGFGYATCSTAAATAAKTAALSSYTLTTGGIVAVKFTNAVPAGATLNINSKGAKAIYYRGAAITAGVIKAGDTVTMIYSTYYHIISIDRDEAPVTSVNGQTGAVSLSIPSTAADVGAIAAPANPSSAQDLVYLNGAWVAADKVYIVNCTPTALDYSGTMDKTVAQIYAAHQEGKTIVYRLWTAVDSHFDTVGTMFWTSGDVTYPSFNAFIVLSDPYNSIVFAYTGATNNGAQATYGTNIYPLSTSACIPAPATPTTGDFLCWNGSSWAATSLSTWQGGNYGS